MDDIKSISDYRFQEDQLEFAIEAYLRKKGWNHTSSTPGCYWMWEKEIQGRMILVDTRMAIKIQSLEEEE